LKRKVPISEADDTLYAERMDAYT